MQQQRPIVLARRVAALAAIGQPLPHEVGEWLADGINAMLYQGIRLDEALGLAGTGYASPTNWIAKEARDWNLRCAATQIEAPNSCARARLLAGKVSRFASASWPRLRSQNPPEHLVFAEMAPTEVLRIRLWWAFANGAIINPARPVPDSPRQIYRIIAPR
jgi:hypothetical protein